MANLTSKQLAAFRSKCADRQSGCVEWTGCKNQDGYGEFMVSPQKWKAHRLSWVLANGPISDGLHVLHRCDNPSCVNLRHLFLGTHADNMADRSAKGRQPISAGFMEAARRSKAGVTNPNARLSADDVLRIRQLTGSDEEAAATFSVTAANVRLIRARKTWAHI